MNADIVRKLLSYDKSILLWARQTGKTTVIFDYLKNYIQQNKNCDILFFCNNEKLCDNAKHFLFRNCHSIIVNNTGKFIHFINKNKLKFCSIKGEYFISDLHYLKPELIIFDDISEYVNGIDYLIEYVNGVRKYDPCKCLLSGTFFDCNLIKSFDRYNDFYINLKKENKEKKIEKKFDLDFINVPLDIEFFSYKPTDLLDVNDIRYERKKKLARLNEISKKLKEENGR